MARLDATDWFPRRHIGPSPAERDQMLEAIGAPSLDALIDEAIPSSIRLAGPLDLPAPESEHQYLRRLTQLARGNKTFRSYIGLGYHDTITPSVILRMVMENPGWYTPYTPYQAEIAQGRLESLLNFQTMVTDLTGMEVANASLLDEATAGAEAMALLHRVRTNKAGAGERSLFLVSDRCLPQTIDVLRSRAEPLEHRPAHRAAGRDDLRPARVRGAAAVPGRARRAARPAAASSSRHTRAERWWRSAPICWRWR